MVFGIWIAFLFCSISDLPCLNGGIPVPSAQRLCARMDPQQQHERQQVLEMLNKCALAHMLTRSPTRHALLPPACTHALTRTH